MAVPIEKPGNPHHDESGGAPPGKGQTAGMPTTEAARKRAVRRGANIHVQDEDQAPTGKNAGDERAAIEAAESGRRRPVAHRITNAR